MEVKAEQLEKQLSPRDVTVSGIMTEIKFTQFWKQPASRDVTKVVLLNVT